MAELEVIYSKQAQETLEHPTTLGRDWFADVLSFHRTMNLTVGPIPEEPAELWEHSTSKIVRDRLKQWLKEAQESMNLKPSSHYSRRSFTLVGEEFIEWLIAVEEGTPIEIASETVDLIYVLLGYVISHGIDIRPVWKAIQAANMRKQGGPKRFDGKQGKPLDWRPADLNGINLQIDEDHVKNRDVNS